MNYTNLKIGFTGTHKGMNSKQLKEFRILMYELLPVCEFHHGDCIGADFEAHIIAFMLEIPVIVHPPSNLKKRAFCPGKTILPEKPYLERNHDIVDNCDLLIATPNQKNEILRSGTWATIRYAKKTRKDVRIIFP